MPAKCEGKAFQLFIDLGATHSFISPACIRNLNLPLHNDSKLSVKLLIRKQAQSSPPSYPPPNASAPPATAVDTQISGLTWIFASTAKEVENLVAREFNSDPNLHKNPNVELVGDYAAAGGASEQFSWSWKWRPPKQAEDRGGGWRTSCSFVEYNQRAHRLDTLASFSFWVQNAQRMPKSPRLERLEVNNFPQRLRVPSTQSIESRVSNVSDSEGEGPGSYKDYKEPQSPMFEPIPENSLGLAPTMTFSTSTSEPVKVDVAACKPSPSRAYQFL